MVYLSFNGFDDFVIDSENKETNENY